MAVEDVEVEASAEEGEAEDACRRVPAVVAVVVVVPDPDFGRNRRAWGLVGSLLAVMNGLPGAVRRRRAMRCVVAIVPAVCWAYQPSVMWEKFSLERVLLRSEKGNECKGTKGT